MDLQVRRRGPVAFPDETAEATTSGNEVAPRSSRRELDILLQALGGADHRSPLVYNGDPTSALSSLRDDAISQYRDLCGVLNEPERYDITSGSSLAAYMPNLHLPQIQAATSTSYGAGKNPYWNSPPLLTDGRLGGGGSGYNRLSEVRSAPAGRSLWGSALGGSPSPLVAAHSSSFYGGQPAASPISNALALYGGAGGGGGWGDGGLLSHQPAMQIRRVTNGQLPTFVQDLQMNQGSAMSLGISNTDFQREESMLVFPPVGSTFDGASGGGGGGGALRPSRPSAGQQYGGLRTIDDFQYHKPSKLGMAAGDYFAPTRSRQPQDSLSSFLDDYAHGKSSAMRPVRA